MSYILHHIQTVEKLIGNYKSDTPFAVYLKDYFSKNKKHGSKDRKSIAHLCYTYFRLGNCLRDKDFNTRIKTAVFLCNDTMPQYAGPIFKDENLTWPITIKERIQQVKADYPEFNINNLFPSPPEALSEGIDVEQFMVQHLVQPKLFVRIRPHKTAAVLNILNAANIDFELIEETCLVLDNKTSIDGLLKINEDVIIQDYSSQKISTMFGYLPKSSGLKVWDCCAASGGKSMLLWDNVANIYLTVSDIRQSIISNLQERFTKAGIKNYHHFVGDASQKNNSSNQVNFDVVIADVPCTGSGTWSRTPEYLSTFKTDTIKSFTDKQTRIINNVADRVNKNGFLIYITCSALKAENENIVEDMLTKHPEFRLIHQQIFAGYNNHADTMYAAILQKK